MLVEGIFPLRSMFPGKNEEGKANARKKENKLILAHERIMKYEQYKAIAKKMMKAVRFSYIKLVAQNQVKRQCYVRRLVDREDNILCRPTYRQPVA